MTAHLSLTLDTTPPSTPVLTINGTTPVTSDPVVETALTSASTDVASMLVWGDVDPTSAAGLAATEDAATWQAYTPSRFIRLSAGAGTKVIYARLRDDVGNVTPVVVSQIVFDDQSPRVSISAAPNRGRVSVAPSYDESTFSWISDRPYTSYVVRVVASQSAPYDAGVPLPSAAGSTNVSGGAGDGGAAVTTTVKGADLRAASPGNGPKVLKVFVQGTDGRWSL